MNTGIPGTELYDRQKNSGGKKEKQTNPQAEIENPSEIVPNIEIGAIKTEQAETTTTRGLQELKKTLLDCYQERIDLKKEIQKAKSQLTIATVLTVFAYLLIFGFFIKWFKENKKDKKEFLADLNSPLGNCFLNIDIDADEQIE